jgi:outer membrane receptor for ferrienterochelin and colicins
MENIRAGQVFGREEGSGTVYKLTTSDYLGLPGRSRHMANLKLFYTGSKGWQASLRAIYRSRWGTFDQDGNGIINRPDETARGFVMLNAGVQKQINRQWLAGAGVENILNHRDAANLPNIAGINAFVSLGYRFEKQQNKNNK